MEKDIFTYIQGQQARYETDEIHVGQNWHWNMRNHIQMLFHLKHGVFFIGENNWLRSFKNIMQPLLNLAYWTEDIEVKHIVFFISGRNGRVKSFLLKKYHDEVYVKKHDIDKLLDEIAESDLDYGGVLVKKGKDRPEIIRLISLGFADQTNLLGGPLGQKVSFAPERLREMKSRGWGDEKNEATMTIDDLIAIADNTKEVAGALNVKRNETSGKNIDVWIVRGSFPEHFLKDNNNMGDWSYQTHVNAFYTDQDNNKKGVILFRKKTDPSEIEFFTSQEVDNRGLGYGEGEALLHPQIWTNFLSIHKNNLLEAASKVVLYTDDQNYANRNKIYDLDNLELTFIDEGKRVTQVPTAGVANIELMSQSVNEWFSHAQLTASAFDPILGVEPKAGTTFRGQERTVAQGRGRHDKRRGQRAKFVEKIYRKFIIPNMVLEILDGKEFLVTLTADEGRWISEQLAENYASEAIIEDFFSFKEPRDREELKQEFQKGFSKQGSKRLFEILKNEFRNIEIEIGINVAGKQKDLAALSDKILAIFEFVLANPQAFQQAMQIPSLAKSFQDILEFSGMEQANFNEFMSQVQQMPAQAQPPKLPQQSAQRNEQSVV